jgi:hypothetical protein
MSAAELLRRLIVALPAVLVVVPVARADEPVANRAPTEAPSAAASMSAESLFVEGRRLVLLGRYPEGCAKLEQSQALDPAPGTQLNLADCYEKSGRLATAWVAFREAAVAADHAGRSEWANQARGRAQTLETSVPRLTIVVDDVPPGLEVRRDGIQLESSILGSAVPLDPNVYDIKATAPRRQAWSTRVAVDAGVRVVLHVPRLAEEVPIGGSSDSQAAASAPPVAVRERLTGTVQANTAGPRTVALGVAAAAIVWAGVGTYLGVSAINSNKEAGSLCALPSQCEDARAIVLTENARGAAEASTVSFVAAGTLFATAAVIFFTAPKQVARPSVALAIGATTVSLRGRW